MTTWRIRGVDASPLEVPLTRPYAIASGAVSAVEMVVVAIHAEEVAGGRRAVGLGAASPAAAVTGETPALCRAALAPERVAWLLGREPLELAALCRGLRESLAAAPAAAAALDMALHDLWAQQLGRPLVDLLGRAHDRLPTSITLGIRDAASTLAEAEEYVGRGFRCLKVKVGLDVEGDVERLRLLRERCGAEVALRVDGNCGYDLSQLVAFWRGVRSVGIELVEQPLPRDDDERLRALDLDPALRRLLAADESMHRADDALRLARPPVPFGAFNIKLMKCGGVSEALRIAAIAELSGIDLMWGCMDESVIGIAAALHAALACPATRYLDLDGSLDLARDPAAGGFALENGVLRTTDAPGLGVRAMPGAFPASSSGGGG